MPLIYRKMSILWNLFASKGISVSQTHVDRIDGSLIDYFALLKYI